MRRHTRCALVTGVQTCALPILTEFSAWIGRSEERRDRLDASRSAVLLAAIGQPEAPGDGDPLPPLHHWLHFWDAKTPEQTGVDGHPRRGGFLPPVPLPRRMWAGGRVIFRRPLVLGTEIRRVDRKSTRLNSSP